jgi:hypothetical protein
MSDIRRAFGRGVTLLRRVSPVALLLLAGCIGGPDCGRSNEIVSTSPSSPSSAVLDAAHPIAEQRFTIHINADALPTTGTTDARLIVAARDPIPAPVASGATGSPTVPPAIIPDVTIIRDDTDEIVPATRPWTGPSARFNAYALASVALDCPMGEACDRTYRVRFAAPSLQDGESVSPSWSIVVDLTYTGIDTYCGTPDHGAATVEASDPVSVPAHRSAFAAPVDHEEAPAAFVARHVTVTADGATPDAASLRLRVVQAPRVDASDPFWRPWVRVLEDGSTTPSASTFVGGNPYDGPSADGATLDIPVLGGCPEGDACRRGYWILFENIAAAPGWADALDPRPSTLGQMSWSVAATSTFERAGESAPGLTVTMDELADGLRADGPLEAAADDVVLKAPTAIDAVFTVPGRPEPRNGLDPMAAAVVVVHVKGTGTALVTRLDGAGAEPGEGYFNGDGTTNLVAHPFDRCPAAGPCTVTLRLIGTSHVEKSGSKGTSGKLSWSVSVLGAPAGTTVTFGDPYEIPAPP